MNNVAGEVQTAASDCLWLSAKHSGPP